MRLLTKTQPNPSHIPSKEALMSTGKSVCVEWYRPHHLWRKVFPRPTWRWPINKGPQSHRRIAGECRLCRVVSYEVSAPSTRMHFFCFRRPTLERSESEGLAGRRPHSSSCPLPDNLRQQFMRNQQASSYRRPQNRSVAQSFRYMRNKPTIISLANPVKPPTRVIVIRSPTLQSCIPFV